MADIGEFAEQAADRVLAYQETAQHKLGLERRIIEEFIKMAFYASLIRDEGRFPSVCLMHYPKVVQSQFHFSFGGDPIWPSAEAIAKMAHAVSSRSHICCLCDNGQIMLGGIHVNTLNELREFGYGSERIPNAFKIVIRSPGHVEVSSAGGALIYKTGMITKEQDFKNSGVLHMLIQLVKEEMQDMTNGQIGSLNYVFNDLAKAIVRHGHGGMILIAKERNGSVFSSAKKIYCLLLQQLLCGYWEHWGDLEKRAGGIQNILAIAQPGIDTPYALEALTIVKDTLMLENCIETIANLAGVDGAIVMDYACTLVAYNAIIDRSVTEKECPVFDCEGKEVLRSDVLKNRGSRHKSALSYACAVPDSFALVISQDGGVSAFHNRNGRVTWSAEMRAMD